MSDEKTPIDLGDASEGLKIEALKEATSDEFSHVHNRLGPMIWALTFDICRENPSPARLNAVLNSLISSVAAWIVAVTPQMEAGEESPHFDTVIGKFKENFASMLEDNEMVRADVSQLGNFQGRQMLLEHQNNALAKAVKELVTVMMILAEKGND